MKNLLVVLLVLSSSSCFSQSTSDVHIKLDDYVEHLIERQGIPGVALAVIKGKEVIFQRNFGFASIEHQVEVSDKSIFRIYSLTKPFIAVGIFQLIEQGTVSLNDEVSTYIQDLPSKWKTLKIKHLLTYSSGLPDMAPVPVFQDLTEDQAKDKVFSQDIKFGPGEQYDYNQTCFWLLQKIIEKTTGKSLADFIIDNQFESDQSAFFSSDSRDIVMHRASPYFPFTKGALTLDHSYLQGTYAHAMNGLNITLEEYIEWDERLYSGKLLSKEYLDLMWQNFPYIKTNKSFAYGWDKIYINDQVSYGFSGSLCTAYRIFPEKEVSIVFLSNGLSKWYNIDNIINHIASLVDTELTDQNNLAFETILRATYDHAEFTSIIDKIMDDPNFATNNFESHLNDVGYFWLLALDDVDKAIDVFEVNTTMFPNSWNVYDSLGEALAKSGSNTEAILNYSKAMELNTDEAYKTQSQMKIELIKDEH